MSRTSSPNQPVQPPIKLLCVCIRMPQSHADELLGVGGLLAVDVLFSVPANLTASPKYAFRITFHIVTVKPRLR